MMTSKEISTFLIAMCFVSVALLVATGFAYGQGDKDGAIFCSFVSSVIALAAMLILSISVFNGRFDKMR